MPKNLKEYLVIAVSSRALFNLEEENLIFEKEGLENYRKYQLEHQNDILKPGLAFNLINNLLKLNEHPKIPRKAEVVIMSRNNAETSLRITKSLEHYNLKITRSAWTSGTPISNYLEAFNVDLFLSANPDDVQDAINIGIAAARIITKQLEKEKHIDINQIIKIAFDGDAVIFSDESEKIYQEQGIEAFLKHEAENAQNPLPDGPFAKLLRSLAIIQKAFPVNEAPMRTALITARNSPAHERVIRTLATWNVRIDEVFFLGGMEKHKIIEVFNPDIYFDDQDIYCNESSKVAPTGKVPYKNKKE